MARIGPQQHRKKYIYLHLNNLMYPRFELNVFHPEVLNKVILGYYM